MPTPVEKEMLSSAENQGRELPILSDPDGLFARNYNRHTFAFQHGLKDHPLFELSSSDRARPANPDHQETYWSNGKVDVTDRGMRAAMATVARRYDHKYCGQQFARVLKHTEQDPVYGPVFQQFLSKVVEFSGEQCGTMCGRRNSDLDQLAKPDHAVSYGWGM